MRRSFLLCLTILTLSGCSCKEWGYCPHLFPNAERFAQNDRCDTPAV